MDEPDPPFTRFPVAFFAAAATQGRRAQMEDTFIIVPDLSACAPPVATHRLQGVQYACVLDGHGGSRCADWLAEHLHKEIAAEESLTSDDLLAAAAATQPGLTAVAAATTPACSPAVSSSAGALPTPSASAADVPLYCSALPPIHTASPPADPSPASSAAPSSCTLPAAAPLSRVTVAVSRAFRRCDAAFLDVIRASGRNDGATALCALLYQNSLAVANIGDTRAVLGRLPAPPLGAGGQARRARRPRRPVSLSAVRLSVDHKPNLAGESERVRACGGEVSKIRGVWRVCAREDRDQASNATAGAQGTASGRGSRGTAGAATKVAVRGAAVRGAAAVGAAEAEGGAAAVGEAARRVLKGVVAVAATEGVVCQVGEGAARCRASVAAARVGVVTAGGPEGRGGVGVALELRHAAAVAPPPPSLAISRAFGNLALKEHASRMPLVCNAPHVAVWGLTHRDRFLILASDGLWDAVDDAKAVCIADAAGREAGIPRWGSGKGSPEGRAGKAVAEGGSESAMPGVGSGMLRCATASEAAAERGRSGAATPAGTMLPKRKAPDAEAQAALGARAARAAAEALVAAAMANGSQDNVTVLVVWLDWEQ